MIKKYIKNLVILAIVVLSTATFLACAGANKLSCQSIVNELTNEKYAGRLTGTEGNILAGEYIAGLYDEIGLEPLFDDSYYHYFDTECVDPNVQNPEIIIHYTDGTQEKLIYGKDYLVQETYSDFSAQLSFEKPDNSLNYKDSIYISNGIMDEENSKYPIYIVKVDTLRASTSIPQEDDNIRIAMLSHAYDKINDFGEYADISITSSLKIKGVSNIVGFIRGNDPTKAIVISAHFDHMGTQGEIIFNGAIDNASGVAAMLHSANTMLEALDNEKPEMDIIFIATNSEEQHSMGVNAFVKDISSSYGQIYNINIDCVGMKEDIPYAMGTESDISRILSDELTNWFTDSGFNTNDVWYSNSDHKVFEIAGYPALTIGHDLTIVKPMIHIEDDTEDYLDFDKIEAVGEAISSFVLEKGYSTFDKFEPYAESEAPYDQIGFGKKALAELDIMLDGRKLAYDEYIYFVYQDQLICAFGTEPFKSIDDMQLYYPDVNIPDSIGDYILDRLLVRDSGHGRGNSVKYILFEIEEELNTIMTGELHKKHITEIDIEYKLGDDYINVVMTKHEPMLFFHIPSKELDGEYAGYWLNKSDEYLDEYSSITYKDGDWWIILQTYQKSTFTYLEGNMEVTETLPTYESKQKSEEEIMELLDYIISEIDVEVLMEQFGH